MDNTFFPTEAEIPAQYKPARIEQRRYLIGGEIKTWDGEVQTIRSPICVRDSNGIHQTELGYCPMLDGKTAFGALEAATMAYADGSGVWPSMSVESRIYHTERFLEAMIAKRADVVNTLMWEIGKTEKDAATEFDRTVTYVRDSIAKLREMETKAAEQFNIKGIRGNLSRTPIGPVLCMAPFNYPLNETFTTMLPAVLTGNPVIFKPAKYGVLIHNHLLEAYRQFPDGVINTIYGDGRKVVTPIVRSGDLSGLAFIGSTGVANSIMGSLPKFHRCRPVLGLGAKNASIVLNDADIDKAASVCSKSAFNYNGQRCTAAKIIFVQRGVANQFTDKFCAEVDKFKWGMPWEQGVFNTPLPEDGKVAAMDGYVSEAVLKGAKIANERGRQSVGTFYSPTVLTGVTPEIRIYHEEQFGPVSPIVVFDSVGEPLQYVQKSPLRQQSAIFGRDPKIVAPLARALKNLVCRVNLNSQCQRGPDELPFMGKKDSGVRELSVSEALLAFTDPGIVAGDDDEVNRAILNHMHQERN